MEGLPEGQKEEIRRRYWLNQTTAEISTATGVPEKEVRKLEAAAAGAASPQDIKGTEGLYVNWRISPFSGGFERGRILCIFT